MKRPAWQAGVLAAVAILVYLPVLRAGFIWDDDTMVTANPLIQSAAGWHRFWWTTHQADFWPVTYTSLWVEWRLWGSHAFGYHATNVLLHAATVVLLWAVLRRLNVPGAFVGAALFAVHPVNVESVAWIAQRKNLLAMLFFLSSILLYLKSGEEPEEPPRPWYLLSLGAFVLAMLSKGSVAFLPLVLLGIAVWRKPLRKGDVLRLLPFFVVAALLSGVDLWYQHHGSPEVFRSATVGERLLGAGAVVLFYLGKAIFPDRLIFFYPAWTIRTDNGLWWLPVVVVVGATIWMARKRKSPGIAPIFAAWLYFVAALIPVMGLTDVYFMKFSLVADHYEHLALLGIAALAGVGWAVWNRKAAPRTPTLAPPAALALIVFFGALTAWRCLSYKDLRTLYETVLEDNPGSWLAHNNLGTVYLASGEESRAKNQFSEAIGLNPLYAEARYNMAVVLEQEGRTKEAIVQDEEAVRLRPHYPSALNNLGNALVAGGRLLEALDRYEEAVRLRPTDPQFHFNYARALVQMGRTAEGDAQYGEALRWKPDFAEAYHELGADAAGRSDYSVAQKDYEEAIRLQPGFAAAYNDLGIVLAREGREPEALDRIGRALQLQSHFPEAENNLALILSRERRFPEAISHFRSALKDKPDYWEAHYGLGLALKATGRAKEAAAEFKLAGRKP